MNKRLDLNLLTVFEAVMRHGSVSGAAHELNLSQPTVSHALGRLRVLTGDRLLVRSGGRLVPTIRAAAMTLPAREVLERARALLVPEIFDPATSQRSFRLGSSDYSSLAIVPGLYAAIGRSAPGVRLNLCPINTETLPGLAAGRQDCSFWAGPAPGENWHLTHLFHEHLVGICNPGHAFAHAGTVDLLQWAAEPHAVVSLGHTGRSPVDEALVRAGLTRRIGLRSQSFAGAMAVLAEGRHVMALPSRLVPVAQRFGLVRFALPLLLPTYPVGFLRHSRTEGDSALEWLEYAVSSALAAPQAA